MPTTTTSTIGSGGDYTTLQAWEDDMTADLVSADEQAVGECLDQNFNSSSNILTIAGHTTDATRNIILTTNGTASFKDKAGVRTTALAYNASNGTNITCSTGYVELITVDDSFVTIRGLQISHTGSGGAEAVIDSQVANNTFEKNIVFSARRMIQTRAGSNIISNNLFQYNAGGTAVYADGGGGTQQVRNNTFVCAGTAAGIGVFVTYTTVACVNNAFFNLTSVTSVSGGGSLAGSDYNATDDSSFPVGSNNVTSLTFADQFESATNDFRAASTGDLQSGTPDATYAPDDITDLTRDATTPWIGAWEVAAAGGANPKGVFGMALDGPLRRVVY